MSEKPRYDALFLSNNEVLFLCVRRAAKVKPTYLPRGAERYHSQETVTFAAQHYFEKARNHTRFFPLTPARRVSFMSRSPADLSAEVRALRLLAAVEWKSSGRQLVTNLQFGPEALEVFIRDLGKIAAEALDVRFLNGDIYVNAGQAEKLFKLEGLALNVCRSELAR